MVILKRNECLTLPNGKVATYDGDKHRWQFTHPSVWHDLIAILSKSPRRYVAIRVGQRVLAPDESLWYCDGRSGLREVECHEFL